METYSQNTIENAALLGAIFSKEAYVHDQKR